MELLNSWTEMHGDSSGDEGKKHGERCAHSIFLLSTFEKDC
jgi:hypothetical protein